MNKLIPVPIAIFVISLLALFAGGIILWQLAKPTKHPPRISFLYDIGKWERYYNEDYGFELRYPVGELEIKTTNNPFRVIFYSKEYDCKLKNSETKIRASGFKLTLTPYSAKSYSTVWEGIGFPSANYREKIGDREISYFHQFEKRPFIKIGYLVPHLKSDPVVWLAVEVEMINGLVLGHCEPKLDYYPITLGEKILSTLKLYEVSATLPTANLIPGRPSDVEYDEKDGQVEVSIKTGNFIIPGEYQKIILERAETPSGPWQVLQTLPFQDSKSQRFLDLIDSEIEKVFYRIVLIDKDGFKTHPSPPREVLLPSSLKKINWQLYRNEKYGFQIKCPEGWELSAQSFP